MALTKVTSGMVNPDPSDADNLSSGSVPAARLGNVDTSGIISNADDIALLGLKVASNGSLAKYNLVDQIIDDFQDASGVDTATSTGEFRSGSAFYSGAEAVNYLGDGSDGALTTSGNVTHTVTTPNGSYDGDMVLKQYTTLTISAGHTMTVSQPCRGMFIYVQGDCTINGSLSMDGKSAHANPTASGGSDSNAVGANGLRLGLISSGGSQTLTNDGTEFNGCGTTVRTAIANQSNISSNGTIFTMSRAGAASGAGGTGYAGNGAVTASAGAAGTAGTTGGTTLTTGGGGGGGSWQHHGVTGGPSGGGGLAGVFGGASGGGATTSVACGSGTGNSGGDYGGAGGAGKSCPTDGSGGGGAVQYMAGGGSGNPGGAGASQSTTNVATAVTGAGGGIIWLIVGGVLTIGAAGSITAQGTQGALHTNNGANSGGANGGSSGGGSIFALSGGTFTNSGSITAAGGASATTSGPNGNGTGGAGGAGGVHSGNLFTGDTYGNMTLVSTANTASGGAPTKGDLVATYTDYKGTASVGTDLKFYISRDGTNYTGPITMESQGTTGGHTILTAHDVSLTSASGTSMKWKIETLNQSASKVTRIHGISLGWS